MNLDKAKSEAIAARDLLNGAVGLNWNTATLAQVEEALKGVRIHLVNAGNEMRR